MRALVPRLWQFRFPRCGTGCAERHLADSCTKRSGESVAQSEPTGTAQATAQSALPRLERHEGSPTAARVALERKVQPQAEKSLCHHLCSLLCALPLLAVLHQTIEEALASLARTLPLRVGQKHSVLRGHSLALRSIPFDSIPSHSTSRPRFLPRSTDAPRRTPGRQPALMNASSRA